MKKHLVHIGAKKSDARATLTYSEIRLPKRQARFKDRIALQPEIDLKSFKARAVIDWLDLEFATSHVTQWKWVKKRVQTATGLDCYVKDICKTGEVFVVRFQEPELRKVRMALAAIAGDMGISGEVFVQGIEVSLDFTPKNPPAEIERAKLFTLLVHHFLPSRNVLTEADDHPRFTWGPDGKRDTDFILPKAKASRLLDPKLFNGKDRQPSSDSCVYYGSRESDCFWRIMPKIIDRQHKREGTFVEIEEKHKRVRIEVSLKGSRLESLGLRTFEDLASLNTTSLTKHFRFARPIFVDEEKLPIGILGAARRRLNRERIRKFKASGVVGLKTMDEAWRHIRNGRLPDLKKRLRSQGMKYPVKRSGMGSMTTFAAYDELNARVDLALRKLVERVERQMTRGA